MDTRNMECPHCGRTLRREEREEVCEYKGSKKTYLQPAWWCDGCDEAILKGDDNIISNTIYVELRARVEGVLSPSQVQSIRKKLALTQRQSSKIFGGGTNAFQKYESGENIPSVGMSLLFKFIGDHSEYLQSIATMREQFHNMPWEIPGTGSREVSS